MFETVFISTESIELIKKLNNSNIELPTILETNEMARDKLVEWLNRIILLDDAARKKHFFFLESLRASLLNDLNKAFLNKDESANTKTAWYKNAKFILLMIGGSLIAICEGFDGIASILGLVASVPTFWLFIVGAAFALLSVMIFFLANMVSMANTMNVSLSQSRHILDVLVENIEQLKILEKALLAYQLNNPDMSLKELQALQSMARMLQTRYYAFHTERDTYREHSNTLAFEVAKTLAAIASGAILSAGVFFSCQTISLAIGGLFVSSIAATFWPIVLTCTLMSVIAFASFWTTGRPELDDEVAYWMGQSPEQIEIFTNEEDITKSKSTRLIAYCDSRLKAFNSWEQQKSHPHLFQKATNGENERFLGRDPEFLSDSREISGERLCEP